MTAGIYRIRNRVTGQVYIGSSKNLEFRMHGHFVALTNGRHDNVPLLEAWQAFGVAAFAFGILEVTEPDNAALIVAESRWIATTGAALYNVRKTGKLGRHERTVMIRPPAQPRGRRRKTTGS